MPHVASPELAAVARGNCGRCQSCAGNATTVHRPREAHLYNCRNLLLPLDKERDGFVFHGDNGRYDGGSRGAIRDIGAALRSRVDFRAKRLHRNNKLTGLGPNSVLPPAPGVASAMHAAHRRVALVTMQSLLNASICFVPQGDIMTTRRLFDALAAGCVPAIVRSIRGSDTSALVGNLPFPHTIDWRALAFFLAPANVDLSQREKMATGRVAACRRREAKWFDSLHSQREQLARMRRFSRAAFSTYLDVEFNPSGTVTAMLRELHYIVDDHSGIYG